MRGGSDSDLSSSGEDGCASKKQRQAGKKTAFPSDFLCWAVGWCRFLQSVLFVNAITDRLTVVSLS